MEWRRSLTTHRIPHEQPLWRHPWGQNKGQCRIECSVSPHTHTVLDVEWLQTDPGTNTNLRDGRAGDAADLDTTNGASSSEESIRVKSWWMAPPTTAGGPRSEPSRTLHLRRWRPPTLTSTVGGTGSTCVDETNTNHLLRGSVGSVGPRTLLREPGNKSCWKQSNNSS